MISPKAVSFISAWSKDHSGSKQARVELAIGHLSQVFPGFSSLISAGADEFRTMLSYQHFRNALLPPKEACTYLLAWSLGKMGG